MKLWRKKAEQINFEMGSKHNGRKFKDQFAVMQPSIASNPLLMGLMQKANIRMEKLELAAQMRKAISEMENANAAQ